MIIEVTKEDFLAAPKGFYGTTQCPLYHAAKRVIPNLLCVSADYIRVEKDGQALSYPFKNWTEDLYYNELADQPEGFVKAIATHEDEEKYYPKQDYASIVKVNQLWMDARNGKDIEPINVEIIGL